VRVVGTLAVLIAVSGAIAVLGTWPMAAHLRTHVVDPGSDPLAAFWSKLADVHLTLWILAWDVHALTTAPTALFDANIFHPAPHTLALSENLLGALPAYLPLALAWRDPVLAHQATLLFTFAAAFLAMALLVHDWTGSWPAAGLAGVLFSFSGLRMGQLHAIHLEGNYWLPLLPLFAHRAAHRSGAVWPVLLAVALVLSTLHSYYLGYAAFVALALVLAVTALGDAQVRARFLRLLGAAVVAASVVLALSWPYVVASDRGTIGAASVRLLELSSARLGRTGATAAAVLAIATLPWAVRSLRSGESPVWVVALGVLAVAGHALALGPAVTVGGLRLPGPFTVLQALPGFGAFRAPLRFNVLAAVGLAALAGCGVAGLARSAGAWRHRARTVVDGCAVVLAIVTVALSSRALSLRPVETWSTIPAVYRWLATAPPGPVLELPFRDVDRYPLERDEEARRTYRSVYHWHPLLNGYSGYTPPTYAPVSALVRALPDPRALDVLRRATGLRWIVLHDDSAEPAGWGSAGQGIAAVHRVGEARVVELAPPETLDLLPPLLAPRGRETTPLGTRLAVLPATAQRAELQFAAPPPPAVYPGVTFPIALRVRNVSDVAWPAFAAADTHLVQVGYRWEEPGSGTAVLSGWDRLPYDLAPGESVTASVAVTPPQQPGPKRLVLGLGQDDSWFPATLDTAVVVVPPGEIPPG